MKGPALSGTSEIPAATDTATYTEMPQILLLATGKDKKKERKPN